MHTPPEHVSPAPHVRPHIPQFASSVEVSTHAPPQHERPALHAAPPPTEPLVPPHWHRPPLHDSFAPHVTPQPPQCAVLVLVVTHPAGPQQVSLIEQTAPAPTPPDSGPHVQRCALQTSLGPHTRPHPPQFCSSRSESTHVLPQHRSFGVRQTAPVPALPVVPPQAHLPPASHDSPGEHTAPHAPHALVPNAVPQPGPSPVQSR